MRAGLVTSNHFKYTAPKILPPLFYLFESEQNVRRIAEQYSQDIQPGEKTKKGYHLIGLIKKNMTAPLKQTAGIDVAKNELVVSLGRMNYNTEIIIFAHKTFANTKAGFAALLAWTQKQMHKEVKVTYVMEATGVYHEALAYYLSDNQQQVCIVLPNKISNYFRTLDIKTITDKSASQAITRFGLERKLDLWEPRQKVFRDLRQLTRERDQLVQERTMLKNQLHAEQAEAFPNEGSVTRIEERIALLNRHEKEVNKEIAAIIKRDEKLVNQAKIISSIPGIGLLTAIIILAETNGFELIQSKKQLASYAGFDVKEKISGISVKGVPKISKRGNRYLRKAMHLPSITAIRMDERFKAIFGRLISRHGIKMKAVVAIQRKMLELSYTLWKNNVCYDKAYLQQPVL